MQLQGQKLFSASKAWHDYRGIASVQAYQSGINLYTQGTRATYAHLAISGLIKLTRISEGGHELITGLCFPVRLLGAASIILGKEYPVTAVTLTPCRLHSIPAPSFLELLRTDIQFSWLVQNEQSRDIYEQISQLAEIGCLSARQRLERVLGQFLLTSGTNSSTEETSFRLPLRLWEVAELIAVSPEHLSRILSAMQQEGILRRDKNSFTILDPKRLPFY
jgi:CRP-like cAMP-binding protein